MSDPPQIAQLWFWIEDWFGRYHPEPLEALNAGATEDELAAAEQELGFTLPIEVRESFFLHNGQQTGFEFSNPFGVLELLSLGTAVVIWQNWQDLEDYNEEFQNEFDLYPSGAIQLHYTNTGWFPLLQDSGGNSIGVDLAPGPSGHAGQVINFGRDESRKTVLAKNWREFLFGYLFFLYSGLIEINNELLEGWEAQLSFALDGIHLTEKPTDWKREGNWPYWGE